MDSSLPEPQSLLALVEALRRLPGVGVRTARRMAYHLLQHDLQGAQYLGAALSEAVSIQNATALYFVLSRPQRIKILLRPRTATTVCITC